LKFKTASILIVMALIIAIAPLYVYISYPNASIEEEAVLEENVIGSMPFRPPRFLIGSVIYSSTRELVRIQRPIVEPYDGCTLIKLDGNRRGLLLLAPSYVEVSTNVEVSGKYLVKLMSQGEELTVRVVAFTTKRGSYAIVLEVVRGSERYVIATQRR